MVGTTLIACLAIFASAAIASPIINEAASATSASDANIDNDIARLHKMRNNERNKIMDAGMNWNGIVQPSRTGVSTVSALVTMPTPSTPPGGTPDIKYSGTAWVGIDGYGSSPLWQTGVFWNVEGSDITFSGWWDWCAPDDCRARGFPDFQVSPGDAVSMVVVGSGSSGTAYLTNANTGQMVHETVSGMSGSLTGVTAEWIVEDFLVWKEGQVPFSSFNPITFSQCSFADSSGGGLGLSGAIFVGSTEQPDGKPVVYTTVTSADSFFITYNGTSY